MHTTSLRNNATMRNLVVVLLVLSLYLLSFLPSISLAFEQNISIRSIGSVVYNILVLRGTNIDNLEAEGGYYDSPQFIADHTDLYVTWYYQGDLVPKIHAIRPDLKVLIYRNVRAVYTTSGETAKWLLKDENGSYIYNPDYPGKYFLVDIGDPEYQDYVANWIKSQIDEYGFDGVFADWGIDAGAGLTYGLSGHAINPRTEEPYTVEEWVNGTIATAKEIKAKIGSKLYVGNGINNGNMWLYAKETYLKFFDLPIDGLMAEMFFTLSQDESSWKNSLDFMMWLQDNFLPERPNGAFLPYCRDATTNEQIKYLFSSCLLGVKDFSKNYLWMRNVTCLNYTQSLFKIHIGIPTGDCYVVEGTHIYARNFTKAIVLVNPTPDIYTIKLEGQSITMYPQTGFILSL